MALIKSGDVTQGSALLDAVGQCRRPPNEEQRSLRDRANVALGFAALQDSSRETRARRLERVRLNEPAGQQGAAGLRLGRRRAEGTASRRWCPGRELAQRDPSDAAVLEARIAVPYAYAELRRLRPGAGALQRGDRGVRAAKAAALDESIAAIRAGKLLDGLLERNPGERDGLVLEHPRRCPRCRTPATWPRCWRSTTSRKPSRTTATCSSSTRNLQDWHDNLGVFGDMLANRRQAFAERLPQVRAKRRSTSSWPHCSSAAMRWPPNWPQAEAASDGAAFADARQRELLERLASVRGRAGRPLGSDAEPAGAQSALRLAAGALTWQLAQAVPGARCWEAQKALREHRRAARRRPASATRRWRRPSATSRRASRPSPRASPQLDATIQALTPRVAALTQRAAGQVQELAVAELAAAEGAPGRLRHAGPLRRGPALRPRQPRANATEAGDAQAAASRCRCCLLAACWLCACASKRSAHARQRAHAEDAWPAAKSQVAPDSGVQASEEQAIAAYRKFLEAAPKAPQRAEAMRRLGDLEMDSADTRSADGQAPRPTRRTTAPPSRATRTS